MVLSFTLAHRKGSEKKDQSSTEIGLSVRQINKKWRQNSKQKLLMSDKIVEPLCAAETKLIKSNEQQKI